MTVSVSPASPAFDIFSFVSCEDVKAHLALLRDFHDIRKNASDDDTWQKRVADSVTKFETWARKVQPLENPSISLDLDILMVWHTYLLNPVKYQHDVARLYPGLLQLDFADMVLRMARGSLTPQAGRQADETAPPPQASVTAELSDLEAAVQRQASFIDKVARLGWGEKATDEFLTNCIHRYGCFLDLMKTGTVHSLVPTLDLAWHSHQLRGSRYCKETKELLGHVLNHDDSIPETQLSRSFDETNAAWQARFGTTYLAKRSFAVPGDITDVDGSSACGGGCNGECGSCGTVKRGSCSPGECGECESRLSETLLGAAGCGGGCNGECGSCGTRA
ncbi:hypothetical protein M407DRAFT_246854 [Tulasnella calospora MUT 4182]|uniref:Uncharacterized protein n=1 Tax=Tulasnella calospora MUT 4182 TaxID=1051891 RepID=A0A0C3Q3A3_9AGAM|nr:hypothetical protein M407DRAFT_246854 [Tulasnella calospora MUT 4182]